MTTPPDTLPIDYEIDPDADPGDLVAALARLLVEAGSLATLAGRVAP